MNNFIFVFIAFFILALVIGFFRILKKNKKDHTNERAAEIKELKELLKIKDKKIDELKKELKELKEYINKKNKKPAGWLV